MVEHVMEEGINQNTDESQNEKVIKDDDVSKTTNP